MVNPSVNNNEVRLRDIFLGVQEEMTAKLKSTRSVVAHPGTKGAVSEASWLEMLKKYLPERYAAESAFVLDSTGQISDQIDVVVYDRHFSPLLLSQEGVRYVPAESVYGVFEVKQELNRENIDYAADKASSVRKLLRTSAHISHAGGRFEPKAPEPILAGILTLGSSWNPAIGDTAAEHLKGLSEDRRLQFGCVLENGAFVLEVDEFCKLHLRTYPREQALIRFFLSFLANLQRMGSVPAIDYRAYASALNLKS